MASIGNRFTSEQLKKIDDTFQSEEVKKFINNHPKLTEAQAVERLKGKGIKFNIMSKEEAIIRLKTNTYLFKIGVYRLNYNKDSSGKYIDLDFAYMDDLAILDMRFRRIMLDMSLNLEHALKTLVQSNVTKEKHEDGYSIVKEFELNKNFNVSDVFGKYSKEKHYLYNVSSKHSKAPSIWVLLEIMSFGDLSKFIEFYYNRTRIQKYKFKLPSRLIRYAKNVRNAAAHNNPLLVNLNKGRNISPDPKIMQINAEIGIDEYICRKPKINDILCLFYLHDLSCSDGVKKHLISELKGFQTRAKRNNLYYEKNEHLLKMYETLGLLIDYYEKKC